MGIRILVAEDEDTLRSVITEVLTDDGHDVTGVPSAEQALERFRAEPFPLVLTDIVMGKMNGIQLLEEIKRGDAEAHVIIMTSHASLETATGALRTGAFDYLIKPFEDLDQISNVVNKAIDEIERSKNEQKMVTSLKVKSEELAKMNDALRTMADRDGLTGLHNHRYFRQALDAQVMQSSVDGGQLSLIFIDVDHFKIYNDTHGHLAGDDVLRSVSTLLNEHCPSGSIVARYGGEEFVLLLSSIGRDEAIRLAELLRKLVADYPFSGRETQPTGKLTLSLGVASFPEDGADGTALIAAADRALYQAKDKGRNTVCTHA